MDDTTIELKLLTLDLLPAIKGCLGAFPKRNCDLNLCNLFTWGSLYKLHYFVWKNAFTIYNPRYHYIAFPFCYDFQPVELFDLVIKMREHDPKVEMILFPDPWLEKHPDATQYFRFRNHEAWADYVYLSERLASLSGKKLAKKKNLLSQFRRQYPDYTVSDLTKADEPAVLEHFKLWKQERHISEGGIGMEYKAIQKSFDFWDSLILEGFKIELDGRLIAWTIFSEQTADMVTVHFEKYDPDLKGCGQLINWETAMRLKDRYTYINREQDMGMEGLRHAKRSYEPVFMVPFTTSRIKLHENGRLDLLEPK